MIRIAGQSGEMSMDLGKTVYLADRKSWRAWLVEHHDSETEVWLIYYRKETGKPRISYNDAVEEALCYGWVDSIVRGIDEERFAQRFSKRKEERTLSDEQGAHTQPHCPEEDDQGGPGCRGARL